VVLNRTRVDDSATAVSASGTFGPRSGDVTNKATRKQPDVTPAILFPRSRVLLPRLAIG
jgi:hypothetical protein